jgi:hypothetical protein
MHSYLGYSIACLICDVGYIVTTKKKFFEFHRKELYRKARSSRPVHCTVL